MLDWDKLRIFHTAAESGSFTHAAEKLGMSQSAVVAADFSARG